MRVQVNDVMLWFDVLSPSVALDGDRVVERPVLIGVHGGPGIDSTGLIDGLAPLADMAQVVRFDQRGHGRSDRATPDTWNLARWADDVHGICQALGIDRPIVYGGSFGARVALTYAARHPDHPRALIISHGGGRIDHTATIEAMRRYGGEHAARVAAADAAEPGRHHAEWLTTCLPLYSRKPGAAEHFQRLHDRSILTPEVTAHYGAAPEHTQPPVRLDRISCPVLLLVGDHDPSVPVAAMEEVRDQLTRAHTELVIFPDCGHTIFRDQPDQAYATIRSFIASVT